MIYDAIFLFLVVPLVSASIVVCAILAGLPPFALVILIACLFVGFFLLTDP